MCGFVGIFSEEILDKSFIESCNKHQISRGPDDKQYIAKKILRYNFSSIFNRLSIIDLNQNATQPMEDSAGNILLFNGEIFNHKVLRNKLENEGIKFKTSHSDSEVVLKGISKYGINYINNFIGQFSIFYFSNEKKVCYLVRDRLGQKPLYYSFKNKNFSFASNLKTLVNLVGQHDVSDESLHEYFYTGVIKSPNTLFTEFKKIRPGEILSIDLKNQFKIESSIYWDPKNFIGNNKFDSTKFFNLLEDSTKLRLESDVEIANYLSGGIDSTAIIKLLKSINNNYEVNTFTVSSNDKKYDEAQWAGQVVSKYNTNHLEEKIDNYLNTELIRESIVSLDEPYSDPSTVPAYLIAKKISKHYKVAISGDGGDELLGGYVRIYNSLRRFKLNQNLIKLILKLYPFWLGTGYIFSKHNYSLEKSYLSNFIDYKIKNIFKRNVDLKLPNFNFITVLNDEYKSMILFDFSYYLPEMMMLKIDKTSMSNSVEVRSPFVDHRLVELILSSEDSKSKSIENSKYLLKEYLLEDFEKEFVDREKKGFMINLENWIYQNKNEIITDVKKSYFYEMINFRKFEKLFSFKSRTNALRIWKFYLLSVYLNSIDS